MEKLMKLFTCTLLLFVLAMAGTASAQDETRKLTKKEKKMLQARLDSLQFVEAEQAITDRAFVLEANQVIFKRGQTANVTSNTNFISVEKDHAVVQVSFNVPSAGPNGVGGVTVEGMFSNYEVEKDKKGNVSVSFSVMGTGISARVDIRMYKGSRNASVTVTPNFHSNRITLNGEIVPLQKSRVFKGRSL